MTPLEPMAAIGLPESDNRRLFSIAWPFPLFGTINEVSKWFGINKDQVAEHIKRRPCPAPHRLHGNRAYVDTLGYYQWLRTHEVIK